MPDDDVSRVLSVSTSDYFDSDLELLFDKFHSVSSIFESRQKNKNWGTNVLGNIFEENYCLLNKLQNVIQWKENLARIQSLARILTGHPSIFIIVIVII